MMATLLALAIGGSSACTGSPQPTPTSAGPATGKSPVAYTNHALDLIGSNLFVDAAFADVRTVARQRVEHATTTAQTYAALRDALAAAGQRPGDLISTADMTKIPASTQEPSATTADGITVLALPGFVDLSARPGSGQPTAAEKSYARRASAVIANATGATTCGWIVDVRGSGGTDVPVMIGAAAALLPPGVALVEVDRTGATVDLSLEDDAVTLAGRSVLPLDPVRRSDRPVVVLQDRGTTRAGEAVVLAFRGRDGSTSVGTATFGDAVDGTTEELADGAHLFVTRWRMADRSGTLTPGPIAPDRVAGGSPVLGPAVALDQARSVLRDQCR